MSCKQHATPQETAQTIDITAVEFSDLASVILRDGHRLRFRARGASMRPFLRDGDIVEVVPATAERLRRGYVALYLSDDRRPILHRVLAKSASAGGVVLQMRGDSVCGPPELVPAERVLGLATCHIRGQARRRLDGIGSRMLGLACATAQTWRWYLVRAVGRVRRTLRPATPSRTRTG